MWRIAIRKSSRKLNSVTEQSCLACHSSIRINERLESPQLSKIFSFNLSKPGRLQGLGFHADNVVDLSGHYRAAHSPWCGRIENEGFRDLRSGTDALWLPRGARAFANSAAEVVVSSDMDEEGLTSASCSEEERSSRFECRIKQGRKRAEDREKYNALKRRQVKIETDAWQQAVQEYRELLTDMCASKLAPNLPFMKSLLLGWFEPLRDAIVVEQRSHLAGREKSCLWKYQSYGKYLCELPPDKLAVITMHKLIGMMMTDTEHGSVKVIYAALHLGEAVEQEVRIHKFLEKTKKKSKRQKKVEGEEDEPITKDQEVLRKRVNTLMKQGRGRNLQKLLKGSDDSTGWNREIHAKVGSRLIEILLQTAFIQPPLDQSAEGAADIRPAFKHSLKNISIGKLHRQIGVIECDPLVRRGLDRTARHMVMPYMPMLVRPLPWKGYASGGYLFLHSNSMRIHGAREQRDAIGRAPFNQMKEVYKALDILGSTKWRVNTRILDVVDRIWAAGGRLAGLTDREDVTLPEKPDTEDEAEIKCWKLKSRMARKTNTELHSCRCDTELKLSVARKMKDEEGFYYPHNLDFRGRAYPMHPHLNHLGSDLCRGILEFAEGRPLGKRGLSWLKIHLANLFATGGVDKLSYDGRIAFVEDNIDNIIDSAKKPLEGKRWWLEAEDPLQCLSACMDLSEALKSSCPESFISHIPIHQDGSCNGLQHYAALGRDKVGAALVNLIHCDKPADVYTGIARRVDEIMQKDALDDIAKNQNADNARLLLGQVDRKLVKQTVMTSVYGVTFHGARDQILRRLRERGFLDDRALFTASSYVAKVTLTALGEMFNSARDIMTWLADCAKIIAIENESVRWTTPLGLPVVQPYRKQKTRHVKTSLQTLTLMEESDKVMVNRQKTAFPPNFVHSLDGSHMMMTAIACNKAGLTFAGVHDSYWTHACAVDQMNEILRKKFVELYSKPILENLLDSFERTFPQTSFPSLPDRSDFDLNEVLKSPYFFN